MRIVEMRVALVHTSRYDNIVEFKKMYRKVT
jgi:hypothetical protein